VCEENLIEYPGIKYNCVSSIGYSYNNDDEENNITLTREEFNTMCTVDEDVRGMNEYECVYNCDESQIDCSRKCLPKLWKWKTITVDGEIVGNIQTDKLIQFEPVTTKSMYCAPDSVCSMTPKSGVLTKCDNCTNCNWTKNDTSGDYEYLCDNCKNCIFSSTNDIHCGGRKCSDCTKQIDSTQSISETITCKSCKYIDTIFCTTQKDNTIKDPPEYYYSVYNQGQYYRPENTSLDNVFDTSKINSSGCTNKSCATIPTIFGRKGYLDGGTPSSENTDCMKKGDCGVDEGCVIL
jgi:hypothetical protein